VSDLGAGGADGSSTLEAARGEGAPPTERASEGGEAPSGGWLRRHLKPIVLLLVAVVSGLGALILFPKDSQVSASGTGLTTIIVSAQFAPFDLSVDLSPYRGGTGTKVFVSVADATKPASLASVAFVVPASEVGSCEVQQGCEPLTAGLDAEFESVSAPRLESLNNQPYQYEETADMTLPRVGYAERTDHEFASALLPVVQVNEVAGTNATTPLAENSETVNVTPAISYKMVIDDPDRYSWVGGTPPLVHGNVAQWSFTQTPNSPTLLTGVALSVQDLDNKLIFVAGALLGIAGGALVGAIQEAIKSGPRS
jgi:hypothetical protein